jgi:hypothetical protein
MDMVSLNPAGKLKQGSDKEISDPLNCLSFGLMLAPNSQLRHFFKMMVHYPILTRLNTFLPDLMTQYRKCPQSGCYCDDFDHLEFTKTIEMVGFPGEPRLEIYTSFQGIKKDQQIPIRNYPQALLLDNEICLGKLKHVVFGDKVDTFEFNTVVTLFEFIDGIVWELSFHVLPQECQLRR